MQKTKRFLIGLAVLVPALCGLACHFRLKSSEWGCPGTPPEVWILGISLNVTFTDASQSRLEGTMEIGYDHRPAGSTSRRYNGVTVVKKFEIKRIAA